MTRTIRKDRIWQNDGITTDGQFFGIKYDDFEFSDKTNKRAREQIIASGEITTGRATKKIRNRHQEPFIQFVKRPADITISGFCPINLTCSQCGGDGEVFQEGTAWWRTLIPCNVCEGTGRTE